ncbi:very-long-chain (3R)-3-hydroxyacyl-CoA dehydratase 3 [Microcaecilia unicolor]|uniref:Very-long-chain (3R)-3-hydroxyacyl-CoA dehydratase n=1 Tax=Microcaecilia unicolor TaxID=1415580 RepID=A0A6P7X672_9AMPH|nr:very-long-chain (3R)-3-hydroxyacyl-CoA dehydratase 3 [Microcaecilia unicolor]
MEKQILTPQVYWAQRHREIYLRVGLSDVKTPEISITRNALRFRARGHGAKGDNVYEFHLEFLEQVKSQPVYKVTERQVCITVQKEVSRWWDRLTKQEKRPVFLAPDFDRWLDESDAEMELNAKADKKINSVRMESRVPKDPFVNLKRGYLFMYNLVQFLGFSWIFVNMTVRLFVLGKDSFYDTFHTMADVVYFCQMLAVLEIIHPLIGLVKSGIFTSVLQVFGRNFILFVVLGCLEEMQNKAVVFFIFYSWSIIEIIRYPFYMLACMDTEWRYLTWLRYTIWIPLYLIGGGSEAIAVIQAIPIVNETGKFSIMLPYLGLSISFSLFLYAYLILSIIGLALNYRHLYKQRQRCLGQKKRKVH